MADKTIRHFDFKNDLVIDLRQPAVAEVYAEWDAKQRAMNAKDTFDVTESEIEEAEAIYDKFLAIARQYNAVSELT